MDILTKLNLFEMNYKIVIRKGQKLKKLICKPGYKQVNGKCVKMSSSEKINRSRSAIKSAKKKSSKMDKINKKRNKSLRKRVLFHIDKGTNNEIV